MWKNKSAGQILYCYLLLILLDWSLNINQLEGLGSTELRELMQELNTLTHQVLTPNQGVILNQEPQVILSSSIPTHKAKLSLLQS